MWTVHDDCGWKTRRDFGSSTADLRQYSSTAFHKSYRSDYFVELMSFCEVAELVSSQIMLVHAHYLCAQKQRLVPKFGFFSLSVVELKRLLW